MAISAADVWPVDGLEYDVREEAVILGFQGHIVHTVTYQPSDRWKPEIVWCTCKKPNCQHVQAVIEFRRRGEG